MNYTCLDLFGVFSVESSDWTLFHNLSDLGVSFCGTLILNQSGSPTKKVQRPHHLQYPVSGVLWE